MSCLSRTDDHDPCAVFLILMFMLYPADNAVGKAHYCRCRREHKHIHKVVASRNRIAQKLHSEEIQHCAQTTCRDNILCLRGARKCPKTVIQLKDVKHQQRDHHVDQHKIPCRTKIYLGNIRIF